MADQTRYTITGKRPGSTIFIAGRFLKPHEDGGYVLSDAQKKALADQGLKIEEFTGKVAPRRSYDGGTVNPKSRGAQARLAEQAAAAAELDGKVNKVPSKRERADVSSL